MSSLCDHIIAMCVPRHRYVCTRHGYVCTRHGYVCTTSWLCVYHVITIYVHVITTCVHVIAMCAYVMTTCILCYQAGSSRRPTDWYRRSFTSAMSGEHTNVYIVSRRVYKSVFTCRAFTSPCLQVLTSRVHTGRHRCNDVTRSHVTSKDHT